MEKGMQKQCMNLNMQTLFGSETFICKELLRNVIVCTKLVTNFVKLDHQKNLNLALKLRKYKTI